jgi:hypothetical protein
MLMLPLDLFISIYLDSSFVHSATASFGGVRYVATFQTPHTSTETLIAVEYNLASINTSQLVIIVLSGLKHRIVGTSSSRQILVSII